MPERPCTAHFQSDMFADSTADLHLQLSIVYSTALQAKWSLNARSSVIAVAAIYRTKWFLTAIVIFAFVHMLQLRHSPRFGKFLTRLSHDGKTHTCRCCNRCGHFAKDCPNTVWFNCDGPGHKVDECTHEELCCICKKLTHRVRHHHQSPLLSMMTRLLKTLET